MTAEVGDEIQYWGPPAMTVSGKEVLAFHLHRFLAPWLHRVKIDRLTVTVGFECSVSESCTFVITAQSGVCVQVGWTYDDLVHAYRFMDGCLRIEASGDASASVRYDLVPVVDTEDGADPAGVPLGFVVLLGVERLTEAAILAMRRQAAEAIRAARRNAMRLYFDEHRARSMKGFLYGLMEHLPEWTGCDHSASLVLTSNLEAVTLENSPQASFGVLAERLFLEAAQEQPPERLVGMTLALASPTSDILREALRRQRREPGAVYHVFVRRSGADGRWYAEGEGARGLCGFHRCASRADEAMYVLVPLVAREGGETEMLGFLCLASRAARSLNPSAGKLLAELASNLAAVLRFSPLYTMSARKLWILGQIRGALEDSLNTVGSVEDKIEGLIGEVSALIARHVQVPSFAVAYVAEEGGEERRRHLRYVHPLGWTHFEQLNLPLDVPEAERVDSGVSSLSVRLQRPLVLAGGHGEGDAQSFKNYLHVHEAQGELVDARAQEGALIDPAQGWVRLQDYYKPARSSAYATLAYPVVFAGEALGVVTIEVERTTNWLWWTGFGGQLFWQRLAGELAFAFFTLRQSTRGGGDKPGPQRQ